MGSENKNIHSGHRQRMRNKALKYGFDMFEEHEILEMLLYTAIPQKDTNPIAHELINEFGSFHAVFEAPENELLKVKGMTNNAVFLIKMMPTVYSFYTQDKLKNNIKSTATIENVYLHLAPKYVGKTKEIVMVVLLDSAGRILGCEPISEGVVNATEINTRKMVELCIKYNASQVVLSHNHPSGNATPSTNDFIATKSVSLVLKSMNIALVDHLIIAETEYCSMANLDQFKSAFK